MTWLSLLAAIALFASPLASPLPSATDVAGLIQTLVVQTQVPNLVSAVILHTRLFDAVSEVVVFTLAAVGVQLVLASEPVQRQILGLEDAPSQVLCELGSTIAALVPAELALRGHLSPGGGFAAGVAGGTAIGLQLISGGADRSERRFRRFRADLLEKAAVVGFLLLSMLALLELTPGWGPYGALLSGGWIPLLNLLVGLKVTLGSWAMVQRLVRRRGLL